MKSKRLNANFSATSAVAILPIAATANAQLPTITALNIARWKIDGEGNALVQLHDGSIHSLANGTYEIIGSRLVPSNFAEQVAMNAPVNSQPVTTGDLATLGLMYLVEDLPKTDWMAAGAGTVAVLGTVGFVAIRGNSGGGVGAGESGTASPSNTVTIVSEANGNIFEGMDGEIFQVVASSETTTNFVYAIDGGPDAQVFQIDGSTGAISFAQTVYYHQNEDSDQDSIYELDVRVSDADGNSGVMSLALSLGTNNDVSDQVHFASSSPMTVSGTETHDRYVFGSWTAAGGDLTVDSFGGDDVFIFGSKTAYYSSGRVTLNAGDGDNYLEFGSETAFSGRVTLNVGDGDNYLEFGDRTASSNNGSVLITAGDGNNQIVFNGTTGIQSGGSGSLQITIVDGKGGSTITFNGNAGTAMSFDLGDDLDEDAVIFSANVPRILQVINFDKDTDRPIDIDFPSAWSYSISGNDIVFSTTLQSVLHQWTFYDQDTSSVDPFDYLI